MAQENRLKRNLERMRNFGIIEDYQFKFSLFLKLKKIRSTEPRR